MSSYFFQAMIELLPEGAQARADLRLVAEPKFPPVNPHLDLLELLGEWGQLETNKQVFPDHWTVALNYFITNKWMRLITVTFDFGTQTLDYYDRAKNEGRIIYPPFSFLRIKAPDLWDKHRIHNVLVISGDEFAWVIEEHGDHQYLRHHREGKPYQPAQDHYLFAPHNKKNIKIIDCISVEAPNAV